MWFNSHSNTSGCDVIQRTIRSTFVFVLFLKFQIINCPHQNKTWRFSSNVTESVFKYTLYCSDLYTVACVKFNYGHAVQPLWATLPNWRKHRPGGDPAGSTQHWAHCPGQGRKMDRCHVPTPQHTTQSHDPDTLGVGNGPRSRPPPFPQTPGLSGSLPQRCTLHSTLLHNSY